jgi:ribonucleoside-diphosphate reductase alpha chain
MTPMGKAYISINEDDDGNIFEIFINVGRAGSDITADAEAIGRLISLTFTIPTEYTSDQIAQKVVSRLRGIGGSSSTGFGAERVRSLGDAVAKAIDQHQIAKKTIEIDIEVISEPAKDENIPLWTEKTSNKPTDICPDCGSATLRFTEGCQKCELCGFSKC